jgi:hypothetical protein
VSLSVRVHRIVVLRFLSFVVYVVRSMIFARLLMMMMMGRSLAFSQEFEMLRKY